MSCFRNKLPIAVLLLALGMSSISCTRKESFDNPFDPNVALTPPGNLQVVSMTDSSLTLRWSSLYNTFSSTQKAAAWVIVAQSFDGKTFTPLDSLHATDTTGTINHEFMVNKEYYFRIHERLGTNETLSSNVVTESVPFPAPLAFKATFASESNRSFEWQSETGLTASYVVERGLGQTGTYSVIGRIPSTSTSFSDTTVVITDTTYYYRLYAASASGTLSLYDSIAVSVPFPPPTSLNITCLSPTSVRLGWTDHHSFETGYEIWESVNAQPFSELTKLPMDADSDVVSGLNQSARYKFEVAATSKYNVSKKTSMSISFVSSQPEPVYSVQSGYSIAYDLCFSPDGSLLACSGIDSLRLLQSGNGRELASFPAGYAEGIPVAQFSPDGKLLAANTPATINIWSVSTFDKVADMPGDFGGIHYFSFTPDGGTIAATSDNGNVQLWNVSSESIYKQYGGYFYYGPGGSENYTIAISPHGKYVAVGLAPVLLNLTDGSLVHTFADTGHIGLIAFDPTGSFLACINGNNHMINLFSVSTGTLVRSIPGPGIVTPNNTAGGFAFDPGGSEIAVAASNGVDIYDIQSGNLLTELPTVSSPFSVTYSPLKNLIAVGSYGGVVQVWALPGAWKTDF